MLILRERCDPYFALLYRDLLLYWRQPSEWLMPLLFFMMVTGFFALAFPYEPSRLSEMAPGIIWTALLLAILFSLESRFQSEFKTGSLEELLLSPHSLSLLMLSKTVAQWVAVGLPLTLMAPVMAVFLHYPVTSLIAVVASVGLGSLLLSLLAIFGSLLTLGLHRGGIFLTILVLPLMFPILLLGVGNLYVAGLGLPWSGHLALLGALLILALCFVPLLLAATLRASITLG